MVANSSKAGIVVIHGTTCGCGWWCASGCRHCVWVMCVHNYSASTGSTHPPFIQRNLISFIRCHTSYETNHTMKRRKSDTEKESSSNGLSMLSSVSSSAVTESESPPVPSAVCGSPDVHSLHMLSENLRSLLTSSFCSDAEIDVDGQSVRVHRCVLSARSPFFRSLFEARESKSCRFKLSKLLTAFKVEYEALMCVLGYLYSGKQTEAPTGVCTCADWSCSHESCRPAIDFALQLLYSSHVFQLPELVSVFQRRLLNIVNNAYIEDVIPILAVASISVPSNDPLVTKCIKLLSNSEVDPTTLEKKLSPEVVAQILADQERARNTSSDINMRRIHKALDSDDIELVKLLLNEGKVTLDSAYALHYAAAYCDSKITIEVLELGNSDLNLRDKRGFTVLHIAAMRKDPAILVGLITKGANPTDMTPDGRTALRIAKRQTKFIDYNIVTEQGKETPKDRLCIEILEQAETRDPFIGDAALTLALEKENMRTKMLYLENRVSLARLLFPLEAKLAMQIANAESTSEIRVPHSVDLNETALLVNKENLSRYTALRRTVELGKRFFPRCSQVLNNIMDDELHDFACLESGTAEERALKRRRYDELKAVVSQAFTKDKEDNERSGLSSSSSSSSLTSIRFNLQP